LSRQARRVLGERQRAALERATAAVVADPDADVEADLRRLQTYERLLQALEGSERRNKLVAAVIGLACVAAIGAALVVRVPATRVTLFADATSATFTLAEPWRWEHPASGAGAIRLEGFDDVDLPAGMAAELAPAGAGSLDFAGGSLSLAALSVGPDARVTLEADDGGADVFVKGGEIAGELTLTGAIEVAGAATGAGDDWTSARFDLALPEIVAFASHPVGAVPAQLRIGREDPISFFGVGVRSLSFARERASGPGSVGFESTIRDGRLVIAETRREVPLRRGDHVEIGDAVDGRLVDVVIGDTLEVAFEGKAGSVDMVQAGTRTDLRPTLLEYVYHNERLIFVWSALGVIWGMAWSVRRALV
jgi:hypothetical protein